MRQRILNGTLPLGQAHPDPIHDGEAFISHLVTNTLDDWGMYITDDEHAELILDLLTEALKLEQTFNPERNQSYAGYASWILRKRVVDLGPRKLLGRNGGRAAERTHEQLDADSTYGELPNSHLSDNGYASLEDLIEAADRHFQTGSDGTQPARPSHTGTDRPTTLRRLERERARRRARAALLLGLRAA